MTAVETYKIFTILNPEMVPLVDKYKENSKEKNSVIIFFIDGRVATFKVGRGKMILNIEEKL